MIFSYRRNDPLCVKAVFQCQQDVTWLPGRNMLASATCALTDSSDFAGWPDPVDLRLWPRLGTHPDQGLLNREREHLTA